MLAKLKAMWRMRSKREDIYSKPGFWNDKASTHSGTAVSMFVNRHLNEHYQREQFAFFDNSLGDINDRRILDVGCGTGRLSRHLAAKGARVRAFDFAEKAIEIARLESKDLDIEYSVGSVFDIDDVRAYDCITVLGCLTAACKDPEQFMLVARKLHAALVPGGKLVLIEPFHKGFLHRVLRLSSNEAMKALEECGFNVVGSKELHFWPVRLLLTIGETPAWLTNLAYPVGEFALRCTPASFGLGDYKGIALERSK